MSENAVEHSAKRESEHANVRIPLAPINVNSSALASRAEATPTKKPSLASKLLAWGSSSKYPPKAATTGGSSSDDLAADYDVDYMVGRTVHSGPVSIVSPPRQPSASTSHEGGADELNPRRQLLLVDDDDSEDVNGVHENEQGTL
jgi:hypothetical protein